MTKAAPAPQPNSAWHAVMKAATVTAFVMASVRPASGGCFATAGERYGIAPSLLKAIAVQESALNATAIHANSDGTRDIGVMQINTQWLGQLEHYGIHEEDLWDPCINIQIGAWILASYVARYGYTWDAVGAYNTGHARTLRALRYEYDVGGHLLRAAGRMRSPAESSGQRP